MSEHVYIGLNFGITKTSACFSFGKNEAMNIVVWPNAGSNLSPPTCVLYQTSQLIPTPLDQSSHLQYHAVKICSEAEHAFAKSQQNCILVKDFKMSLLDKSRYIFAGGVMFPMQRVVTDFLYLVKATVSTVIQKTQQGSFTYHWTLAAPGLYSYHHLLFFKACAVDATFPTSTEYFQLVFEPECALVASIEDYKLDGRRFEDTNILVIDVGEKIVSLACYHYLNNNSIKMISKSTSSYTCAKMSEDLEKFVAAQMTLCNYEVCKTLHIKSLTRFRTELSKVIHYCKYPNGSRSRIEVPISDALAKMIVNSKVLNIDDDDGYLFVYPIEEICKVFDKFTSCCLESISNKFDTSTPLLSLFEFVFSKSNSSLMRQMISLRFWFLL